LISNGPGINEKEIPNLYQRMKALEEYFDISSAFEQVWKHDKLKHEMIVSFERENIFKTLDAKDKNLATMTIDRIRQSSKDPIDFLRQFNIVKRIQNLRPCDDHSLLVKLLAIQVIHDKKIECSDVCSLIAECIKEGQLFRNKYEQRLFINFLNLAFPTPEQKTFMEESFPVIFQSLDSFLNDGGHS
jgi:hypothetical protein